MPAAMTATPRCCSAPPDISPRRATSPAPCISSSSRPRRTRAAGGVMVEEGAVRQFPVEAVYGMHNWPGLPVGQFASGPGPMMAAFDIFEITRRRPRRPCRDAASRRSIRSSPRRRSSAALQTIASRNIDPLDGAVVSVTQIHGGDTWNVIPDEVVLRGTTRVVRPGGARLARGGDPARSPRASAPRSAPRVEVRYERRYPPTVNSAGRDRDSPLRPRRRWSAADNVRRDLLPSMGAEDFAFMLQAKPGAYIWIGNGAGASEAMLHNPHYDFNDEILPLGASYWARLAETTLAGLELAGAAVEAPLQPVAQEIAGDHRDEDQQPRDRARAAAPARWFPARASACCPSSRAAARCRGRESSAPIPAG